jgi:hypothetical protein
MLVVAGGQLSMGFLDGDSGLVQVGVRISVVGLGLGLFQAAAYSLMLGGVAPNRFSTAAAALSLAQAVGTVLAVTTVGGIFGLRKAHHLSQLAEAGLALGLREQQAFIQAFQDVFWLGTAIAVLGAGIFLLSRRQKGRPTRE